MSSTAPHGPSLRRRLMLPLLWSWLGGLLLAGGGAFLLAEDSANSAFDRGLQDEAAALATRVTWSDRGPLLDVSRQTLELLTWDSADRNAFAMFDLDGFALAGDDKVPLPLKRDGSFQRPVLFDGIYNGESVRGAMFSVTSPMFERMVTIVVVETKRKRDEVTREMQVVMVLPAMALGGLTFALLGWGVRRGLKPLDDLGHEVARRELHDWRALPLHNVPAEVVPMVQRINTLLLDVQQSLALQRRFVADAAHQLRTPVAGIRILAQELERELAPAEGAENAEGSSPAWRPLLRELGGSTERLTRLIEQLLSLARSETALSMNAEHRPQDIVPLLRDATEPLVLQSLREGRQIELEAPDTPVIARSHPVWLGEVVNNLLDNARRYGGPSIWLRVQALPAGGAEIVVEDDGPGVPADELPRLFEPFWRGERADLRSDGGTGLGLTIAKEIVERMGGSLVASLRPQGAGMRFSVRLAP